MVLTALDQILEKTSYIKPKKVVVVSAEEQHVLEAIKMSTIKGITSPILIGTSNKIKEISKLIDFDISSFEVFHQPDSIKASKEAVGLIHNNKADIIMKGMVSTSTLLKEVVDRISGISDESLLSHIAICQMPGYHKLLTITDAAMNIKPSFDEKIQIIKNAIKLLNTLGYQVPKVAILCPIEKENPKIESTMHATMLTKMNKNGQITGCVIEGPLALDNILSKDAAIKKGIQSEVVGDADIILAPDLDSGNILYKSIVYLAGGIVAAVITGASVPIILTSRADSALSKFYSIALATTI